MRAFTESFDECPRTWGRRVVEIESVCERRHFSTKLDGATATSSTAVFRVYVAPDPACWIVHSYADFCICIAVPASRLLTADQTGDLHRPVGRKVRTTP